MSAVASEPSPLSNRGELAHPQKTVLHVDPPFWPVNGDPFRIELDRLRIKWGICSVRDFDPPGPLGCAWHAPRKGPNRGAGETAYRRAYSKPKGEEGGIFWEIRSHEGLASRELIAEFNPAKFRGSDWVNLRRTAESYGANPDPWVERWDEAFTRRSDPYQLRLESPRRAKDGLRETARGFETETIGYVKGTPIIVQKYDKGRERAAAGQPVKGPRVRVELRIQRPWMRERYPDGLRLSQLGAVEWPMLAGEKVLEFVRGDDAYSDPRFLAIAAVARLHGTRQARSVANELLGRDGWSQAEFCIFRDLTPYLAWIHRRHWPTCVAGAVHELGAG